jgi:N-acetylmuramoyl-L-alanine amidase
MPDAASSSPAPRTAQNAPSRALRRLRQACVLLFPLCVLPILPCGNGYGAPLPVEQRYAAAKSELAELRAGRADGAQREAWLRAAEEFHEIYTRNPKWSNRPAALFRMAECLEELAGRSRSKNDYRRAAAAFEELARRHEQSRPAGDALLRAAVIRSDRLNEQGEALRLLGRLRARHARDDALLGKALKAERDIRNIKAPAGAKNASPPRAKENTGALTRVAWKTLDANRVRLTVELDRNVVWQARREQAGKSSACLVVDINGAVPVAEVKSGARVAGSPLTAVRVDCADGKRTRLRFDFTALADYAARMEREPFRLVFDVRARKDAKAEGRSAGRASAERARHPKKERAHVSGVPVLAAVAPQDLASQLGLTVQSVFLDAGHGGKDPGAVHNEVVEREVALDVTRRVGRLLRNRGLDVRYSREKDRYVSLGERTRQANNVKADLFVSVHINAAVDPKVSGFETYYLDIAGNAAVARLATVENAGSDKKMGEINAVLADFMLSARTHESRRLAQLLQGGALARLNKTRYTVKDGGVKAAPFHVLIGTGMPAVLVELGYCSNAAEARRLADPAYRKVLAEGIAEGILAYRDRLQRARVVDLESASKRS